MRTTVLLIASIAANHREDLQVRQFTHLLIHFMREFFKHVYSSLLDGPGALSGPMMNPGMSSSKSMNSFRKLKYEHHMHPGNGSESMYDSRHRDVRSPNMAPHPPPPHHHHHHHVAGNGVSNMPGMATLNTMSSGNHPQQQQHHHPQSHEQMSAMMNMFNPMMAAFIQQLANGMQPTSAPQSGVEVAHNGSAVSGANHHHAAPPWNQNEYVRNNGVNSAGSSAALAGAINQAIPSYTNSSQHSRFKGGEKF